MEETIKHTKAFEYYYLLGDTDQHRSCVKVAKKFNVNINMIYRWRKAFDWENRIIERDKKAAKELAKRNIKDLVNTRADYRREVKQNITVIKALLIKAAKAIKNGKIKVKTVKDVAIVLSTYDMLVKLDMALMGDRIDEDKSIFNVVLPEEFKQQNINNTIVQQYTKQDNESPQLQTKGENDKYIVFN